MKEMTEEYPNCYVLCLNMAHVEFRAQAPGYEEKVRRTLKKNFRDSEGFALVKDLLRWKQMME